MTSNLIKTHLSEEQYNRTIQLLRKTKLKFGCKGYNSMKKILLVGIVIDYMQNLYGENVWIRYELLLQRNERLIENNKPFSIETINTANGITPHAYYFFGVNIKILEKTPISEIETLTKNNWMKENSKNTFIYHNQND